MKLLKDHSLSLILLGLLLLQSWGAWHFHYQDWVQEQHAHGQAVVLKDWWNFFGGEYLLSVLADTYGMLLIVLLSKRFIERGSAESKE